jgi:hypothetical protein
MRTAREERETKIRASTPREGPMGPSVRSFLFPSLPFGFSLRRGSLLTEERDVLLLSLIPRRRVRIRFSRQIPCLQAAATSLFGINLSPPSCTLRLWNIVQPLLSFSLFLGSSPLLSLCRRTIHGRTVFLA